MKWLVDLKVSVGDSEATITVTVDDPDAQDALDARIAARLAFYEQHTIEAGNARPVED